MEAKNDVAAKAEELLAAYGRLLSESRAAYADAVLDDEIPDPPFYAEPVTTTINHKRILRRAVILAAALILVLGTLIVSVDAIRLKLSGFLFDEFPGHTKIIPSEAEEPAERAMPDFRLGYVPEGYEMVDYDKDEIRILMTYDNGNNQYIHFDAYRIDSVSPSIDNDTLIREEVQIGEYQAWYFYNETSAMIIWQRNNFLLTIDCGLNKEEVIKMAESVVQKKNNEN